MALTWITFGCLVGKTFEIGSQIFNEYFDQGIVAAALILMIPWYIASGIYLKYYRSPLKKERKHLQFATFLMMIWGVIFFLAAEYYLMKVYKYDYWYSGYGDISTGTYMNLGTI